MEKAFQVLTMVLANPWNDFNPDNSFVYPFDEVVIEPAVYNDVYQRPVSWLVASLVRFGSMVDRQEALLAPERVRNPFPAERYQRLSRLWLDMSINTDWIEFNERIHQFNTKTRIVIPPTHLAPTNSKQLPSGLPDLRLYEEAIIYSYIPPDNKCAVFHLFISPPTENGRPSITIQAYFMGGVDMKGTDAFVKQIITTLELSFEFPTIVWWRRMHIPPTFSNNNLFLTFTLIHYLQRHGNYLDISREKMMNHKLELLSMLQN